MKSDCCFDEGRRVPGRTKRAAIVSLTLILLVAVCAGALTYTVRSSSSSPNEADKDLPVLKIGVTDNDPYVYVDTTGDYAGIDIDIAREACKRAGIKPQFIDISWNDRDRLLKNGDIDCLWCDYSPCYREDKYYWTEPYLTLTVSVAAKKTSGITSLAHLDGSKTIAVIAGSVSDADCSQGIWISRRTCKSNRMVLPNSAKPPSPKGMSTVGWRTFSRLIDSLPSILAFIVCSPTTL